MGVRLQFNDDIIATISCICAFRCVIMMMMSASVSNLRKVSDREGIVS